MKCVLKYTNSYIIQPVIRCVIKTQRCWAVDPTKAAWNANSYSIREHLDEKFESREVLLSDSLTGVNQCSSSIPFLNATIQSFKSSLDSAQKLKVGFLPFLLSSCPRTIKQWAVGDGGWVPSIPSITKHSIPVFSMETSPIGSESYEG